MFVLSGGIDVSDIDDEKKMVEIMVGIKMLDSLFSYMDSAIEVHERWSLLVPHTLEIL